MCGMLGAFCFDVMVCRGVGWFEGNWRGILLFGGRVIAGGGADISNNVARLVAAGCVTVLLSG